MRSTPTFKHVVERSERGTQHDGLTPKAGCVDLWRWRTEPAEKAIAMLGHLRRQPIQDR